MKSSEPLSDEHTDVEKNDKLKKKLDSIKEMDRKHLDDSNSKEVDLTNSNNDHVQITQNSDQEDNNLDDTKNKEDTSVDKDVEEGILS